MTEYVVLSYNGESWDKARVVQARSAHSAIRTFVDGAAPSAEVFVAVPARSWQPVTVEVETKTRIKFS